MSKKFNKSAIFSSALLALGAISVAPSIVLANPAGGDSNAPGTDPATNPTINWGGGGANGSIATSGASASAGTSLAGISWHTDAATAVLSLMRVPNFDFGAWNFNGGPAGSGSNNTNWYPDGGIAGSNGFPNYNNSGITASASAMKFASLASNGTPVTLAAGSTDRYNVTDANRALVVKDMRNGTGGWKVQLAVGSFDRDGSGDGTVSRTSPTGGAAQLKGAALVIVPNKINTVKEASNALVDVQPPSLPTNPVIAYSANTRSTGGSLTGGNTSNAQGYLYGSAVTIMSANQDPSSSGDRGNGQGTWIGDFADKDSVLFTSPTEGLGTYTASLQWTLTSGPS